MFEFYTQPRPYQKRIFMQSKDARAFGLFMEMGTGKTKIIIDTAAYLYDRGEIDGVLVIAPSGVERNWITDELPTHLADFDPAYAHLYEAKRASTKWHQRAVAECIQGDGLRWLVMTYEGFPTNAGKQAAWQFMKNRRILYVLDESGFVKDESAKRTKAILKSSVYAPYRRILTGTPVTQGPFDVHSQIRFLDEEYWTKFGIRNFYAFKAKFGVLRKINRTYVDKAGNQREREVDIVVGYRNVEQINRMIDPITVRVTKEEVLPDLPEKVYRPYYVELSRDQRAAYDRLKEELYLELEAGFVDAGLPVVLLGKLQQIISGFVTAYDEQKDEDVVTAIGKDNPRLDALSSLCGDLTTPAIIFSRYTYDIARIMERLGSEAVRYDGSVPQEQRARNKAAFQAGDAKFFVANLQAAARGLTLTAAQNVIYYANSFNLEHRLQSEDRAHRIGQRFSVQYFDFIAPDTIDTHIVRNLRKKIDIAAIITGDTLKKWLEL